MDGLIPFLVIIGIILRIANAAKGNGKKTAAQVQKTVFPAPEAPAQSDMTKVIEEAVRKAKVYRAQSGPDEECAPDYQSHGHSEGFGHSDDTGCVGGSMTHDTHEGSKKAGIREGEHMANRPGSLLHASFEGRSMDRKSGPGTLGRNIQPQEEKVQNAGREPMVSAKEMRRAMVMAEILNKPVAMRTRAARR